MLPCQNHHTTFFRQLQQAGDLDLRDCRGKRHDLAVVLVQVVIALLSHRDGNLSSIHRHLTNHYEKLMLALEFEASRPVSRAQLPVILSKVSVTVLNQLIFDNFGIELNSAERKWFAADGKELRGSIGAGDKRGEAVVAAVAHESRDIKGQDYYNGRKESEIPAMRRWLRASGLLAEKISLEALHCNPETLRLIKGNGGFYVVGMKENQAELLSECLAASNGSQAVAGRREVEKGHGRIEQRHYQVFDIRDIYTDERWAECGISSLVKVVRRREDGKTGRETRETSYYLSNQRTAALELCQAVRNHWGVETTNWLRDCTFQEDALRSKKRISCKLSRSCGVWD